MNTGIIFIGCVLALPSEADEIHTLEKASLASRQSVERIVVALTVEGFDHRKNAAEPRSEATFWMKKDQLRADHINHDPGLGIATGRRHVEGINCELPGHVLRYIEIPNVSSHLDPQKSAKVFPWEPTFDPRLLGMVPALYCHLRSSRLDSVVGSTDRSNLQSTTEQYNGIACVVVRFDDASGAKGAIWYAIKSGHHPIRFQYDSVIQARNAKINFQSVQTATLKQYGSTWFPYQIIHQRFHDKKLVTTETITIKEVKINEPIPPETFTLGGIGVVDKTSFRISSRKPDSWVWHNGRLITYDEFNKTEPVIPPVPAPLHPVSTSRTWLYWVSAGLVLVAGGFLWRALRRPRLAM